MSSFFYHTPVMLSEVLDGLNIRPSGIYVDLTFGGGGHTKAILERLDKGMVWAFDQDPDAKREAAAIIDDRLHFILGNFRFFTRFLHWQGIEQVDGILADLGTSSYQLNNPNRGFAAKSNGPLDMRMHQQGDLTAKKILNEYSVQQLRSIFQRYGGIKRPYKLVTCIMEGRKRSPLEDIAQLHEVIKPSIPPRDNYQYLSKVFQALRMVVNDELLALHHMLYQVPTILAPNGRFVVLTYHSGEDRPVKNFIKTGNVEGRVVKDLYGNLVRSLEPIHRKVIRPSATEVSQNPCARSARLRIAKINAKASSEHFFV